MLVGVIIIIIDRIYISDAVPRKSWKVYVFEQITETRSVSSANAFAAVGG